MTDNASLPFHSFSFTLIEGRRPRTAFSMRSMGDGMYDLHVEKGSASNPTMQFTRSVPQDVAQRLKDALQEIGVFGWEESYGTAESRGDCRWTVSTVFKEGVFTVSSRGKNEKPQGFDQLLEELYRLDFPRPTAAQKQVWSAGVGSALNSMGIGKMGSLGGMSAGDLGAYSAAGEGIDFSKLSDMMQGGMPGIDGEDMARLLSEAQGNPRVLQQRMRDEFRHMSHDEQERMLDALASMGMASRAWWERFLRG